MTGSNARVLVVDDEPHLRELLVDALSDETMTVQAASGLRDALQTARIAPPDLVVADLCLGSESGVAVIDGLRRLAGDIPAVVITGASDVRAVAHATACRPVEVLPKPLDIEHLRTTIRQELSRRRRQALADSRMCRLRALARQANLQRKAALGHQPHCDMQDMVLQYQRELLSARNDDEVFKAMFAMLVQTSGPLFGAALACDASAELQLVGRFGVPKPDSAAFCRALAKPVIGAVLADPRLVQMDAGDECELFDASIRRYLAGITLLGVPLLPADGEMIGLAVLYRKGEQPFTPDDVNLIEALATPTALAVRRND
jgi:DNA-binding response OmpR family regulator